jgi:hypothetical protein
MIGSGDGVVRVLYDPERSVNGAKLCVVRTRAKVKQTEYVADMPIITPYSLPMFRQVKCCYCFFNTALFPGWIQPSMVLRFFVDFQTAERKDVDR